MAGQKFLYNNAGAIQEVRAAQVSTGVSDADKIIALDSSGKISSSMLPSGFGDDVQIVVASEGLSAGNYVNIWDDAGLFKVRKADASTSGKEAHGFVLASVLIGATANVFFEGTNNQVTGQTPGNVFLSATIAGEGTSTAPTTAGKIVQRIGFAVAANSVNFQSNLSILVA